MYSAYEGVSQNLCQFGYLPTWKASQMGALKKVMSFSKLLTNVSVDANRRQCCFLFRLSTAVERLPQHIIDSYQPGVELGLGEKKLHCNCIQGFIPMWAMPRSVFLEDSTRSSEAGL